MEHRRSSRRRVDTKPNQASSFAVRWGGVAVLLASLLSVPAFAGPADAPPRVEATQNLDLPFEVRGLQIVEHLGDTLPLDLKFVDDHGKAVKLGDYFRSGKPVLLNLVYFECPMLCTIALNGELDVLKQTAWTPGQEFQVVTVSFNPKDTPALAAKKKANYIQNLGRPGAESGWAFLTGDEATVKKFADAVGFEYRFMPETGQYMHAASLIVATPEGRLSRYMKGVMYDAPTLKLSLLEASGGNIGSVADQLLMYCYMYDPAKGKYGLAAMKIMRTGGAVTVLVLVAAMGWLWLHETSKKKSHHVQPNPA
jgi:protein SCO1/2